ncbi:MAG: hypothetical protein JWR02_1457 [Mucilaginibacter sp.]|nr:hypothetical protein [Mucilaginibacter sp.]
MDQPGINRINCYNILAMLAASCVALIMPFELVLLSYAILGPAHYLTEISWLNNRQFFTLKKYDYLLIIAVVLISLLLRLPYANIVFYCFGLSFILLVIKGNISRLLAFCMLIIAGYFLLTNNILRTIFGLYVPTLIHVYIFTGAFMLFGALKDKIVSGYMAFIVFLLCPVLLSVLFTSYHTAPAAWAISNFDYFGRINATTLRNPSMNVFTSQVSIILTRLIAFAYTYHYINWFSKTRIIKWHRISITRTAIITLIWVGSVALYFYNYRLGFKWLFMLSLVHVILEFPLNHRSFIGIGRELKGRLAG